MDGDPGSLRECFSQQAQGLGSILNILKKYILKMNL